MEVFKIDGADFTDIVQSYTTGYNVLLSEKSGRTARGNNVVDIVNRKTKLTVSFLPMDAVRMKAFLAAIEPYGNLYGHTRSDSPAHERGFTWAPVRFFQPGLCRDVMGDEHVYRE